ncbi:MAG: hypothetical protein JNM52_09650 [Betaproteobacteria bacterium]|nr:hypothetical protein [Betaproteobacteria bacterium]
MAVTNFMNASPFIYRNNRSEAAQKHPAPLIADAWCLIAKTLLLPIPFPNDNHLRQTQEL